MEAMVIKHIDEMSGICNASSLFAFLYSISFESFGRHGSFGR
jgi:hypothetical protein